MRAMASVDDIIRFFGGKGRGAASATARKLECTRQMVCLMRRRGYVTGPMADRIEDLSNGHFNARVLRDHARKKGKRVH